MLKFKNLALFLSATTFLGNAPVLATERTTEPTHASEARLWLDKKYIAAINLGQRCAAGVKSLLQGVRTHWKETLAGASVAGAAIIALLCVRHSKRPARTPAAAPADAPAVLEVPVVFEGPAELAAAAPDAPVANAERAAAPADAPVVREVPAVPAAAAADAPAGPVVPDDARRAAEAPAADVRSGAIISTVTGLPVQLNLRHSGHRRLQAVAAQRAEENRRAAAASRRAEAQDANAQRTAALEDAMARHAAARRAAGDAAPRVP